MQNHDDIQQGVDSWIKSCNGDQFKACNMICAVSEQLMETAEYSIMEHEALNWAITGIKPPRLKVRIKQHMNLLVPKTRYITNLLSYIEDEDILECVQESYSESVRIGCLTFYYPRKIVPYKKTRVRVLTRMCWYNRKEE